MLTLLPTRVGIGPDSLGSGILPEHEGVDGEGAQVRCLVGDRSIKAEVDGIRVSRCQRNEIGATGGLRLIGEHHLLSR